MYRLTACISANLHNRLQSVLSLLHGLLIYRRSDHIISTLDSFHWLQDLSESSVNRQSLFTQLFKALHLGNCLIYCGALLTSHQDGVSGRRPPLN